VSAKSLSTKLSRRWIESATVTSVVMVDLLVQ
jgi:hypothetical protein